MFSELTVIKFNKKLRNFVILNFKTVENSSDALAKRTFWLNIFTLCTTCFGIDTKTTPALPGSFSLFARTELVWGGGTVLVEKRPLYGDAINFDKDQVAIFPPPSLFEQPARRNRINWGCFLLWSVLIDLFCVGVKNEDKLDLGFQRNQFQIPTMPLKERRERKSDSYCLLLSRLYTGYSEQIFFSKKSTYD